MITEDWCRSNHYRVVCEADWNAPDGCLGCGPRAGDRFEAAELAEEAGWEENFRGQWRCPAHLAAQAALEAGLNRAQKKANATKTHGH